MSELRSQTVRAFKWDFFGGLLIGGLNLVISIFLARLIVPSDFGIVAIALALVGLSEVFIGGGFSSAIIQSRDEEKVTLNSVFFFNVLVGITLSIFVILGSEFFSILFEIDKLRTVLWLMAPVFFLNALNVVPMTLYQLRLNFRALAVRRLLSSAFGGFVAIAMAFYGFGLVSLVAQHMISACFLTFSFWLIPNWKPSLMFDRNKLMELSQFGKFIFYEQLLNSIFNRVDSLIIAKLFAPNILGHYARAIGLRNQVVTYSISSALKVLFPAFSTIKDDHQRFIAAYGKSLNLVSSFSFLIAGLLFLVGEHLIVLLYGAEWHLAAAYFRILSIGLFVPPLNAFMLNVLIAKGFARQNFYLSLLRKVARAISLSSLVFFDIDEFLWFWVLVSCIVFVVSLIFINTFVKVNLIDQLRDLLPSLAPFALCFIFVQISPTDSVLQVLVQAIIFVLTFSLIHVLFRTKTCKFVFGMLKAKGIN